MIKSCICCQSMRKSVRPGECQYGRPSCNFEVAELSCGGDAGGDAGGDGGGGESYCDVVLLCTHQCSE